MRTDELERLLTEALREGDAQPVDTAAGERRLAQRDSELMPTWRRWSVVLVAAALVGLIAVASLALGARIAHDERTRPIGPAPAPRYGLSPSGLPVGTLVGRVDRTQPGATSTVRLIVRPDGSGSFNAGTHGDEEGDSVSYYEVELARAGTDRAVMRNRSDAAYFSMDVMTLHFSVREATIRITDISPFLADCIVSRGLRADLPGTTLRIDPLPGELSPSGLPVGMVQIPVPVMYSQGTLRLLVRADGTGQYKMFDYTVAGDDDSPDAFDVEFRRAGPGRAELEYQGATCVTLDFTVRDGTFTFDAVQAHGCLMSADTASGLRGKSADVEPLPESGSLA
jgi:hypothetical protein